MAGLVAQFAPHHGPHWNLLSKSDPLCCHKKVSVDVSGITSDANCVTRDGFRKYWELTELSTAGVGYHICHLSPWLQGPGLSNAAVLTLETHMPRSGDTWKWTKAFSGVLKQLFRKRAVNYLHTLLGNQLFWGSLTNQPKGRLSIFSSEYHHRSR